MKNALKKTVSVVITAIMVLLSVSTAFAAGTTVNGKDAKVGDKISYSISLADVPDVVVGVQMYVFFDPKCLELDKDSLSEETFKAGMINSVDGSGKITMTCTNFPLGYDFSKKAKMLSADFKVIGEGNTEITYWISEMYDVYYNDTDNAYLKRYTLTSDLLINGEKTIDEKPPIIHDNDDPKIIGNFVANKEGKGENNDKPLDTDVSRPVFSVNTTIIDGSVVVVYDEDKVNANTPTPSEDGGLDMGTLVPIIAIVLIIIAIIIVVIIKKKETHTDNK